METNVCTVVSIVPFAINEEKPGLHPGIFHIPASINLEPQYLYVGPSNSFWEINERPTPIPCLANSVAKSIVEDFQNSQLQSNENAKPGLFWEEGKISFPDEEKLAIAKAQQHNWFVAMCKLADDDWNRYHQHNVISDIQRTMAKLLNYDTNQHEWMSKVDASYTESCPYCGVSIRPEIVVCPNCRYVIDKKKFAELQAA